LSGKQFNWRAKGHCRAKPLWHEVEALDSIAEVERTAAKWFEKRKRK
jgi:hypothetical protein